MYIYTHMFRKFLFSFFGPVAYPAMIRTPLAKERTAGARLTAGRGGTNTILYYTILYYTILYYTILYYTIL